MLSVAHGRTLHVCFCNLREARSWNPTLGTLLVISVTERFNVIVTYYGSCTAGDFFRLAIEILKFLQVNARSLWADVSAFRDVSKSSNQTFARVIREVYGVDENVEVKQLFLPTFQIKLIETALSDVIVTLVTRKWVVELPNLRTEVVLTRFQC